jgi:GT2 family glycosyltransferase
MISIGFSQDQFYIIDDGSSDDTFNVVKKHYPLIKIRFNSISKGYMTNRSDMMTWSTNKYILSLDDDSHIRSLQDVEDAVSLLESNKAYGIFHFRVFNQIEVPPERKELPDAIRLLRGYIGCGHIISRELIEKIGRYREELVFYCEELDYSLRAFKQGYNVVSRDNLIVHHRIDLLQREKQKSTVNAKGIYGREWRNIHLYSNNLIITGLYYPLGLDLIFFCYRLCIALYNMVIREKQLGGFFEMFRRTITFIPYIFKHSDKLSYSQFFKWFSYQDMTDGNSKLV